MNIDAYLDGYRNKEAASSLTDDITGLASNAFGGLARKVFDYPRRKVEDQVRTTMQNLKPDIERQVTDASDIAAKRIQSGIQSGMEAGTLGAGKRTWENAKPYVVGAGALAIGLPLLMLGLSAADRVMLHRRLKELGSLQKRETELEEEQTALARRQAQ